MASTYLGQHPRGFNIGHIGMHFLKHVSYLARENPGFSLLGT